MNKEDKECIRTNRRFIKENVYNVNEVADKLYEMEIISLESKETIALKSVDRQAFELLDIVVKRGQRAFSGLIEALEETENQEVADRLKDGRGPTSNQNYTNFPVSVVPNKTPASVPPAPTKSSETAKQQTKAESTSPSGNLTPSGSPIKQPSGSPSDVKWIHEIDLTRLKETLRSTDPNFVMEIKRLHGENMYPMTGNKDKRGVCLIMDNIPNGFCSVRECYGMVDAGKTLIRQTLKLCGFKCVNYPRNSGTTEMMKDKILQEMKKPDHTQYSSFLVICVSVGSDPKNIYGKAGDKDPMTMMTIQELQEMMSQCEEFNGKPKVLMVHTVPKSQLQCEHSCQLDQDESQKLSESMQHLSLEGGDSNNSDMFVVSTTLEPGTRFVVKKTGAYFNNALVYVLLKSACCKSFTELMTEMDGLLGSCEDLNDNPYNKAGRSVRVATQRILTIPRKQLFLFPQYEDTGTQVSS